jgi:hypothetical protein
MDQLGKGQSPNWSGPEAARLKALAALHPPDRSRKRGFQQSCVRRQTAVVDGLRSPREWSIWQTVSTGEAPTQSLLRVEVVTHSH